MSIVAQQWLDRLPKLTSLLHCFNNISAVMSAAKRFVKRNIITQHQFSGTCVYTNVPYKYDVIVQCVFYLMAKKALAKRHGIHKKSI